MKQVLNITLGMGMLWLSAGYAEASTFARIFVDSDVSAALK